ncbi:MAG TPA: FtsX-like permease family protein, partial [Bryobacteraceae bacterium]|nr:FtsX-like permease family protein [Bryobacteraceae bacterium]
TAAEVALSTALLVGAVLMLKSFVLLAGVNLGFQPSRVIAMNIDLPALRYQTPDLRLRFFQELERRVSALPGIESAAFANRMPMRGGWSSGFRLESSQDEHLEADTQAVSPGYFATLGIPLLRGRLLGAQDRNGAPRVAVVNQAFARVFLKNADPMTCRILRDSRRIEIVGVVGDIRRGGQAAALLPELYLPAAQTDGYPVRLADFAIRSSGDPHALVGAVEQQVWALDRDQPVSNVRTLEEIINASAAERRFETLLLTAFAALAVALAVIGVFGVLSYAVSQRTPELGIRIAMGAQPRQILAMVLRQAGWLVVCGGLAGLAAAYVLSRYLASLLFSVQPHDWTVYLAALALLAVAALAAAAIPARRGARIDPTAALRYQ